MGVGLYLVYPAFYTDVSDNYRLPRWARVRTDLGGFYFNLLVGLGLLGLYARTGQEFLLLIVLLINLEILHQLVPFVRLDGYWALADLTGLPDFFTYTGAFLADVLPIQLGTRGKLPPLKRWARVVFAAYLLIAVPLLGTLVFLMVRGVPRILATAWDSMHQQGIALVQARAIGDGLAMSFAVLQMGLLALPTVGLVLTLARLARRALDALWSWSRPTPVRRAVGALGTAAAAALLVFLWAPQLPFAHGPGPLYAQADFAPIRMDERGTVPELVAAMTTTAPAPQTDDVPTGRVVAEPPRPVISADANSDGRAGAAASPSPRVDRGDAPPSASRANVDNPTTTLSALPPAPAVPIASPSPRSTQASAVATVVPIASAVTETAAHPPARPSPSSSTPRTIPRVPTGTNVPTSLPTSTHSPASVSTPATTGPTPATTAAPISARTPVPTAPVATTTPAARPHPPAAATVISSPASVP